MAPKFLPSEDVILTDSEPIILGHATHTQIGIWVRFSGYCCYFR